MAYDFPTSPTVGQVSNGYVWDGTKWAGNGNLAAVAPPSDTPPGTPVNGQLWWETDSGDLYIYYNDGTTSQWVQISGPGLGDAPSDGKAYVRRNGVWTPGWQVIHDETLTVAKSQIDVNLLGFTQLRYRLDWYFATAAADSGLMVRNSVDGGATYRSGASDYYYILSYTDFPSVTQSIAGGSATGATITNTFDNNAGAAEVPYVLHGGITAGAAAKRFKVDANFHGMGPASDRLGISSSRSQAVGKSTHLRFMSDIGATSLDVGTRLIVEAI